MDRQAPSQPSCASESHPGMDFTVLTHNPVISIVEGMSRSSSVSMKSVQENQDSPALNGVLFVITNEKKHERRKDKSMLYGFHTASLPPPQSETHITTTIVS